MISTYQLVLLVYIFIGVTEGCPDLPFQYKCKYGNELDNGGCSTCQCKSGCNFFNRKCTRGYYCYSYPDGTAYCCRNLICPPCEYGNTRILDDSGCPGCECVPCSTPKCPCKCHLGYKLDVNGCQTCECNDPCEKYVCPEGEHCVTEYVNCLNDPFCGGRPKCITTCSDVMCDLSCEYGFEKGCDGCSICKCRQPCEGVTCPKYHYCVVHQIFCKKPPCPEPQAYCQNVCEPEQLLVKDGLPINCDLSNISTCGTNGKCNFIDRFTGVCCGPYLSK